MQDSGVELDIDVLFELDDEATASYDGPVYVLKSRPVSEKR